MKKWICVGLILSMLVLPVQAQPEGLSVAGKSALLMDAATGTVLFESNSHEKLAPASVTKVMTLLLIMEAIDSGKISWKDTVTASAEAAAKGGSQIFLKEGETMSVEDMVKSIAVSSANDCACAMAEHIAGSEAAFVELMNQKAKELGMKDTNFVNCTGLDDEPEAENHKTSAYDIALMSRELIVKHPDIEKYTTIWMDTVRNGTFGLSNTNKLIRFYSGATGLKTGFTSGAGYCLSATAKREGMELIAVVMGCETSKERLAACKTLLDFGFANYALVTPELSGSNPVPVKLGTQAQVNAVPGENPQLLISKGQKDMITTQVTLEEGVTAPVSQGQRMGTLEIKAGDQILAQVPMVAEAPVERLTLGQLFVEMLRRLSGSLSAPA